MPVSRTISAFAALIPGGSDDEAPASGSSANSDDEVSYELFKSTLELDGAVLSAIADNGSDGTLRFNGKPAALARVKPGSVLFGGCSDKTPVGLLRYVVESKEEGGSLVLRTVNAPPQVAFTANPGIRPLDTGGGGKQLDLSMVLFDGDGNESTTDDQVPSRTARHRSELDRREGRERHAGDRVPSAVTTVSASRTFNNHELSERRNGGRVNFSISSGFGCSLWVKLRPSALRLHFGASCILKA